MNQLDVQLRAFFPPRLAKRVAQMHAAIAAVMANGRLNCATCGKCYCLTEGMVTKFVCEGWPKCCGATMRYEGPTPGVCYGGKA